MEIPRREQSPRVTPEVMGEKRRGPSFQREKFPFNLVLGSNFIAFNVPIFRLLSAFVGAAREGKGGTKNT